MTATLVLKLRIFSVNRFFGGVNLKSFDPLNRCLVKFTGLLIILLIAVTLPAFASNVKEEPVSLKELKGDSTIKESTTPIPASPTPKENSPAKNEKSDDSVKNSVVPSKSENKAINEKHKDAGKTEKTKPEASPAPQDEKNEKSLTPEGTPEPEISPGEEPVSLPGTTGDDDFFSKKEKNDSAGLKVNFPLYIGSILMVSLITFVSIKFLGKYMGIPQVGGSNKNMIKIIEKQMIGPNKQFCIVEVPGKTVLIGITESEMKVLCELDSESVREYRDNDKKVNVSEGSSTNYMVDVLLRKWQGGK